MSRDQERPAFTLRFRRKATHRALRQAAEDLGISMNELAERAIEHELAVVGHELEEKLRATVELLKPYRAGDLDSAIEQFARAEVEEDDPLKSRAVGQADAVGVGAAFADSVG